MQELAAFEKIFFYFGGEEVILGTLCKRFVVCVTVLSLRSSYRHPPDLSLRPSTR